MFCFSGAIFQIRYEPEVSTREQKTLAAVDSSFFKRLPNEILVEIFKYIAPLDLVRNVAAVSKRFFNVIRRGVSVNRLDISSEKEYAHTNALCKAIFQDALMSLNLVDINSTYTAGCAVQLLKHMGSKCKSVSIGGSWHFNSGVSNRLFEVLLQQKNSFNILEFNIAGQMFPDFWLSLNMGDQFENVKHLKLKCPRDGGSYANEVTEKTEEMFRMFPNLETLQFDGKGSNAFFQWVFAVKPPEKQLPIRRLSLDYRAVRAFPWRNVKNVTALNLTFKSNRNSFYFQGAWVENHLAIVRNHLPLLKNLTHLGLQLDLNHFGTGLGQNLVFLTNLIENNLPTNLLAIVINCPSTMTRDQAGPMLQCIVDQCAKLEVIVLTNLDCGFFPTNILNTFGQCKNLNLFVVQEYNPDVSKNAEFGFSSFVKYEAVKNQEPSRIVSTVLSVEQAKDLKTKIEHFFWP